MSVSDTCHQWHPLNSQSALPLFMRSYFQWQVSKTLLKMVQNSHFHWRAATINIPLKHWSNLFGGHTPSLEDIKKRINWALLETNQPQLPTGPKQPEPSQPDVLSQTVYSDFTMCSVRATFLLFIYIYKILWSCLHVTALKWLCK